MLPPILDPITNAHRFYNILASGINAIIGEAAPDVTELLPKVSIDAILDLLKALGGEEIVTDVWERFFSEEQFGHLSDFARDSLSGIFKSAYVKEIAETFGQVTIGPAVDLLTQYSREENTNAEDFAAAFHGLLAVYTMPQFVANALQGHAVGTILGPLSGAFQSFYWNLGLGFLGWQTLAPLLSSGLQPRLTRHYQFEFRPKRFDLQDLIYLVNVGLREPDLVRKEMQELGWRDNDINAAIELNYRTLSRSELSDMLKAGAIDEEEVRDHLLRQQYNPKYIPFIISDIQKEESDKDKQPSVSRVRTAFKRGLKTRREFIETMQLLGWSREAIELDIAIILDEIQDQQRELTLSQVKAAFKVDQLSEIETRNWLRREEYPVEDIKVIMNTWKAEKAPRILRFNESSVVRYFKHGVLSEGQARVNLAELGYNAEQINVIIQDAKITSSGGVQQISIGNLIKARAIGALTQAEFYARLRGHLVAERDLAVYEDLALFNPLTALNQLDIERGYKASAISRGRAKNLLTELNVPNDVAEFRLNTWTEEKERGVPKLNAGILIELYRKKGITLDVLRKNLGDLGLSDEDINIVVSSADNLIERVPTASEVRVLYTTQTITKDKSIALLQDGGLSRENALNFVKGWDVVLQQSQPTPSVTELIRAVQDTVLSREEFIQQMREKRYSNASIDFYLARIDKPIVEKTKELSKTDILGLFEDELMSYNDALDRLIDSGYIPEDAELLLARKEQRIEDSQAHALFMAGFIDPEQYIDILIDLGYSQDDIIDYLDRLGY